MALSAEDYKTPSMSKKKASRLSLYELMRHREGPAAEPEVEPAPQDEHPPEPVMVEEPVPAETPAWLSPGRAVAVPVGYLLLSAAVVVILLAAAYSVGHKRGQETQRAVQAQQMLAEFDAAEAPRDPLLYDEQPGGGYLGQPEPAFDLPPGTREPARQAGPASTDPRGWGPLEPTVDPREPGRYYFVLAETAPAGATRLAGFCRDMGLEAYVVSSNNPRLRRIIALPGFDSDARSQEATALEAEIFRIGEIWKTEHRGATALKDAYPSRYGG